MTDDVARKPRLTDIWADTIRQDVCQHPRCAKPIWFAQNVKTGKNSPFDSRPEMVSEQRELETGRPKWTIDLNKTVNHFATCIGAPSFGAQRARSRGRR